MFNSHEFKVTVFLGSRRNHFGSKITVSYSWVVSLTSFFLLLNILRKRLADLLQSQIRMIVYPEEHLPAPVYTGSIGQGKKQRVQKSKAPQAFKAVSLCLQAIMHSIASAAEGSCALIKLTSKYPCRHLQNTQNPLKSG